jgi:hypothetical protein
VTVDRAEAAEVLKATGSGADLQALLDAIEAAAIEEALDLIAGTDPIPSSMLDARALRLRRICETLGRGLSEREIEVVFRIASSAARSVESRMQATYPRQMDRIREARKQAMRSGATVLRIHPAGEDERYKVHFPQPSALALARELLANENCLEGVECRDEEHLILPLSVQTPAGQRVNPLTDILGLAEPRRR